MLSPFYVPAAGVSIYIHMFTYIIPFRLRKIYFSCFGGEETDSERLHNLFRVVQTAVLVRVKFVGMALCPLMVSKNRGHCPLRAGTPHCSSGHFHLS